MNEYEHIDWLRHNDQRKSTQRMFSLFDWMYGGNNVAADKKLKKW
jgi:hypothetical protein